jgi:pSer/pThr/pTyr-binding forkhead associated (FHA) protein
VKLSVSSGAQAGREFDLMGPRFVIGRESDCDFQIDDEKASRHHAAINRTPEGQLWIEDLGSTNGTYVNGQPIPQPVPLTGGETITIGDTDMQLLSDPSAGTVVGAPAPRRTGLTMERLMLRRSARTATIVGIVAGALALIAIGVVAFLALTGDDEGAQVEDVVAEVTPKTIQVINFGPEGPVSGGTGWVLNADEGLIVTNNHVVNGHTSLEVSVGESATPREA